MSNQLFELIKESKDVHVNTLREVFEQEETENINYKRKASVIQSILSTFILISSYLYMNLVEGVDAFSMSLMNVITIGILCRLCCNLEQMDKSIVVNL